MREIRLVFFIIVAFAASTPAQLTPLLEAYETSVGMVANPGKRLFARVLDDGVVQFDEVDDVGKVVSREYKLDAQRLSELRILLNKVAKLSTLGEFDPDASPLDHVIELNIRISVDSEQKTLKLVNFAPALVKDPDKYPREVLELQCTMRALRGDRSYKMLGNDCILQQRREAGR